MTCAVLAGLALLLTFAWIAAWPLLGHLDNQLEEAPVSLRNHIRRYLGIDRIPRMETTMSEITDALNRLAQQVNGVSAAQATSFHNLQVAIEELKAGKLSTEQAEIVDRIEKSLTKLGEDAQAGDDGFEHVTEEPGTDVPPVETPVETPETEPGAKLAEVGNARRR